MVESNNFRDDGWLDTRGSPYTDAARMTERFRCVNFGRLEIELTLDDPKVYTKPFTLRIEHQVVADGSELIEFICQLSAKADRLQFRLKVGLRLKPPEAAPAESRLKARWAL